MRSNLLPVLALISAFSTIAEGQQPASSAPAEREFKLPCVADTTINALQPDGRLETTGGSTELAASGLSHFMLMRFDFAELKNMQVTGATLHLKKTREQLIRVSVSTVAAGDWEEGSTSGGKPQIGAANYKFAAFAEDLKQVRWWAGPGSDISDVIFGNGGSRWSACVSKFDRPTGTYDIEIPAAIVQAMVDGLQTSSLTLSDDFHRPEVVCAVASHETPDRPMLTVKARPARAAPAAPPTELKAYRDDFGLEWVSFRAPSALGFEIYVSPGAINDPRDLARATKLENWSLPAPSKELIVALLSLYRSTPHTHVVVRTMGPAGDWSPPVSAPLPAVITTTATLEPRKLQRFKAPDLSAPFVVDDGLGLSLDGKWMRSNEETWWDPRKGPIALVAGRNEFVGFQTVLCGESGTFKISLADWQAPTAGGVTPRVGYFLENYVHVSVGRDKFAPDPLTPLHPSEPLTIDFEMPGAGPPTSAPVEGDEAPTTQPAMPHRFTQSVFIEIFVPRGCAEGVWRNRLIVVRNGVAVLDMPVELSVSPAELPDSLAFKVSLSGRATSLVTGDDSEQAWRAFDAAQRLAHEHRATLAMIPYGADGRMAPGFAPKIDLEQSAPDFDWQAWDARFGPYLSGAAFAGMPRDRAPLDHFVLPFFENWPLSLKFQPAPERSPLAGKYHFEATHMDAKPGMRANPPLGEYMRWPLSESFGEAYQRQMRDLVSRFVTHLAERGWTATTSQVALVNNSAARERGKEHPTGTWWRFSEPQVFDDYLAAAFWNRIYGGAQRPKAPRLERRGMARDPQLARGALDDAVDILAVDENLFDRNRLLFSTPSRPGTLWFSGGEDAAELGPASLLKWCWAARLAGAHGYLVRNSISGKRAWERADNGAIIYTGWKAPPITAPQLPFNSEGAQAGVVPSLRLKLLRRAQQDLDWLELWIQRNRAQGIPEGYSLGRAGAFFVDNGGALLPRWITLLPVLEFPGRLDTVAFEELRRTLRDAAAASQH